MRILSLVLTFFMLFGVTGCKDYKPDSITVLSREEGSGTRSAFEKLVNIDETSPYAEISDSTAVMITSVQGNKNAIGYISLGALSERVKCLKIDGYTPFAENLKNGSYKLSRQFSIITKNEISEITKDFISFILSRNGQKIVENNKYISVSDSGDYKPLNPTGKIKISGSSSVTPVMEKLKEAYIALNPDTVIEIQQSDSSNAIQSTSDGICDIGMISRELTENEKQKGLISSAIATDSIAVIVNKENRLDNISIEQLADIYTQKLTLWSEIK